MAVSTPRFRTRTKVIAICVVLMAVIVPAIGPFTFYASLWPYLSPVLPRPEAVPKGAQAGFNWKGSGTYWSWQYDLPSGCAAWRSGGDDRSYITVSFASGESGCEGSVRRYSFFHAHTPRVSFSRAGSGSSSCSRHTTDLTLEELDQLETYVAETKPLAKTRGERLVIAYAEQFLEQPELEPGQNPCGEEYADRLRDLGKWPPK